MLCCVVLCEWSGVECSAVPVVRETGCNVVGTSSVTSVAAGVPLCAV